MFIWVALNENVKSARILWISTEICSNPDSLQERKKNYFVPGNPTQIPLHGPMTWKVMQKNAWKDIDNLQIKQQHNCTKSRRHAWMIINFKVKEMDQLEKCLLFAH